MLIERINSIACYRQAKNLLSRTLLFQAPTNYNFSKEILMSKVPLTAGLRKEYQQLFNTCQIRSKHTAEVENIVDGIEAHRTRYAALSEPLGVPWHVTGIVHSLEASLRFDRHLHNGDPLTARTKQIPVGRPKNGTPPFSWEDSARDALVVDKMAGWEDWGISGTLYRFETFNGFGYRPSHIGIFSPYLWSYSNHYTSGKFVKDKVYSPTAVSKQCGAAVLLRRMTEKGIIHFDVNGEPITNGEVDENPLLKYRSLVKFSNTAKSDIAEELQTALNQIPGIFVKVDGIPGARTSAAFKRVTGKFLIGDPRI
jgi:lysozyme family protein